MSKIAKNFLFKVEQGKMTLDDPAKFRENLKHFEGRSGRLCIQEVFRKRSTDQNEYYWGVVIAISSEYYGYTPEEMHEAFKYRFLRDLESREDLPRIKSTTELSTVEFMDDYCKHIQKFAAEDGVYIPDPNEVTLY